MHDVTKVMAEARETLEKCQATLMWIRSEAERMPEVGILAFARAEPMARLIRSVDSTLAAFPADWPEAIGGLVEACQARSPKLIRAALAKLEGKP